MRQAAGSLGFARFTAALDQASLQRPAPSPVEASALAAARAVAARPPPGCPLAIPPAAGQLVAGAAVALPPSVPMYSSATFPTVVCQPLPGSVLPGLASVAAAMQPVAGVTPLPLRADQRSPSPASLAAARATAAQPPPGAVGTPPVPVPDQRQSSPPTLVAARAAAALPPPGSLGISPVAGAKLLAGAATSPAPFHTDQRTSSPSALAAARAAAALPPPGSQSMQAVATARLPAGTVATPPAPACAHQPCPSALAGARTATALPPPSSSAPATAGMGVTGRANQRACPSPAAQTIRGGGNATAPPGMRGAFTPLAGRAG